MGCTQSFNVDWHLSELTLLETTMEWCEMKQCKTLEHAKHLYFTIHPSIHWYSVFVYRIIYRILKLKRRISQQLWLLHFHLNSSKLSSGALFRLCTSIQHTIPYSTLHSTRLRFIATRAHNILLIADKIM